MPDLSPSTFQSVFEHLATASKSTHALIKPDMPADIQAAILAVNGQIAQAQANGISAYQEYSTALDRIRELERQIAEMKDRSKECAKYIPKQMDTGVTVYVLKAEEKAGQITHEACPNCFSNDKVRRLAPTHETKYWSARETHFRVHACSSCNSRYEYGAESRRHTPVRRQYDDDGSWRV